MCFSVRYCAFATPSLLECGWVWENSCTPTPLFRHTKTASLSFFHPFFTHTTGRPPQEPHTIAHAQSLPRRQREWTANQRGDRGGLRPSPTQSSGAPTSFSPEERPVSHSSVWCSAPAPAAPPCPQRAAVGVASAGARRRRRAAYAAPARTRATPRYGRRLEVRPTGGPLLIGQRGDRRVPAAAARWGGGGPTLRLR